MKSNKLIFLDRDGVILKPIIRGYKSYAINDIKKIRIYPEVKQVIENFQSLGFGIVVVTNQPDVSNGFTSKEEVFKVHSKLLEDLEIDLILTCFHSSNFKCSCRKPSPKMIFEGLHFFGADNGLSWIIGDRDSDISAGKLSGLRTILLNRGWKFTTKEKADFYCSNLSQAWITIKKEHKITERKL